MHNRPYPWVEPPDWVRFAEVLHHVTGIARVGKEKVIYEMDVDADGIEVTGFDITTDESR